MSKTDWGYLLAGGFVVWWFAWRLERLGKQLEAVSYLVRVEMAELVGNEDHARELLEERRQDQAEEKKANRQFWITWGVIGAGAFAWWWFTAGQH
jgi:hypothetical protein